MRSVEIDGKLVRAALVNLKINLIRAKLTDISIDIDELEQQLKELKNDEKTDSDYRNFSRSLLRLR